MLKHTGALPAAALHYSGITLCCNPLNSYALLHFSPTHKLSITITAPNFTETAAQIQSIFFCRARRRVVRYDEEDDEDGGNNAEIAMMESYTQSARDEALLVTAMVDDQEAQVLVFKGFSSCLSYKTSPDPSRSVLPARAVVKTIDRIRGPFDPSNIQYLEKGLNWDTFRTRLQPNQA